MVELYSRTAKWRLDPTFRGREDEARWSEEQKAGRYGEYYRKDIVV